MQHLHSASFDSATVNSATSTNETFKRFNNDSEIRNSAALVKHEEVQHQILNIK